MKNLEKNELIDLETIDKIGTFYFYDNFMISEINEGVAVSFELVMEMTNNFTKKIYSKNKPFVFITNRINSYSVDPTIHLKTKEILPNTKGFAVITYDDMNKEIAKLEQFFLEIPTVIVNSVEEAVNWANEIIEK